MILSQAPQILSAALGTSILSITFKALMLAERGGAFLLSLYPLFVLVAKWCFTI